MRKLANLFIFLGGVGFGSIVTWRLLDAKYKKITQEEIDSVKEVFGNRGLKSKEYNEASNELTKGLLEGVKDALDETNKTEDEKVEYNDIVSDEGYVPKKLDYLAEHYGKKGGSEKMDSEEKPYIIAPDDFGDGDLDYDLISLNYYADGVLTDDRDIPIEDVEGTVGFDSLKTFGQYEEDCVYVRNDSMKCEFEILSDVRKFADLPRMEE